MRSLAVFLRVVFHVNTPPFDLLLPAGRQTSNLRKLGSGKSGREGTVE
jgi:hypothetical protein